MSRVIITKELLDDLADAVASKTSESTPMTIEEMTDAIDDIVIPSAGTEGTPVATKGTVNNHSVNVTPSVTNVGGVIQGGTHTGTAVSVSASELVSGNLAITENGTGINVANYSTVSVDVNGGVDIPTFTVNYDVETYEIDSITCNYTYIDLSTWLNQFGILRGAIAEEIYDYNVLGFDEIDKYTYPASVVSATGTSIKFVVINGAKQSYDIIYNMNGTITSTSPSSILQTLNVTTNGTYNASYNSVYDQVVVNVQKKYYATITATGVYGGVWVGYPGSSGTEYHTVNDTFEIEEDAVIYCYATGRTSGGDIYVNGESVATSNTYATYNYTVPADTDVEIELTYGSRGIIRITEISEIAPLEITQNGTYTASGSTKGYSPVTVNVSGGVDIPVFTMTNDYPFTATCNKTWAECYALFNNGNSSAMLIDQYGEKIALGITEITSTYLCYTAMDAFGISSTYGDIIYYSNGTISQVIPSHIAPTLITKSITSNGTYNASSDDANGYSSVTVNVPTWSLLQTTNLGNLSKSDNTAADTGLTLTVSGLNPYDTVAIVISANTQVAGRHLATIRIYHMYSTSDASVKSDATASGVYFNYSTSASNVLTSRASTTGYGVYPNSFTFATSNNGTITTSIYYRYNSSYIEEINGTYTARIYGANLYDLIGG